MTKSFSKSQRDVLCGLIAISTDLADFVEHLISFFSYDDKEFDEDDFRNNSNIHQAIELDSNLDEISDI